MINSSFYKWPGQTLITVVLLFSLAACDQVQQIPQLKQLLGKPEKITFLNDSFAVTMPASWSTRTDLNDVADLQMGNLFKEAYAIFISESKIDFDDISLEGHSDLTRSFLREGLKNFQESEPRYLNNTKYKTLRYRITGSVDGLNLIYWHVTIETSGHFHQVILWSLKSKFADNEADYKALVESFEMIKS